MVNSAQSMVASYKYDPFGRIESQSGSLANDNVYRFSSKEALFKTTAAGGPSDLYYYGYRFYDAQTGRWLNRDPIGINGGFNVYRFVNNAPVYRIDAFGHKLWYCTTPTTMLNGIGRHGYIWNDDPEADDSERECGQESCSGFPAPPGSGNNGPVRGAKDDGYGYDSEGRWYGKQKEDDRDVECAPIDGTDDDAKNREFMESCQDGINNRPWLPPFWDCHSGARSCLRDGGHEMPPFRRWNDHAPFGDNPPPILRSPRDSATRGTD